MIRSINRMLKPKCHNLMIINFKNITTQLTKHGRHGKLLPNPGLQRQAQNLSESPDQLFETDDPEDLSHVETDFLNLDKSHKKFQIETAINNENIKLKTIERKYFKSEQVNFLTWSEKEQIRQLNSNDPDEWNVERLAESFPANEQIIEKLLKSKWQPQNLKRIYKHDLAVQKNWELFLQDNDLLTNDMKLRDHLKTFSSNRMLKSKMKKNKFSKINLIENNKPKSQEFSKILLSCGGKYQDIEKKQIVGQAKNNEFDILKEKNIKDSRQLNDTYLLEHSKHSKPLMFNELVDLPIQEQTTQKTTSNQHNPLMNTFGQTGNEHVVKKYESNDILSTNNDEYDIKSLTTPFILENIEIPKRLYTKGAIYKFYDCYYDDDGEFLYRVPGMTGHNN